MGEDMNQVYCHLLSLVSKITQTIVSHMKTYPKLMGPAVSASVQEIFEWAQSTALHQEVCWRNRNWGTALLSLKEELEEVKQFMDAIKGILGLSGLSDASKDCVRIFRDQVHRNLYCASKVQTPEKRQAPTSQEVRALTMAEKLVEEEERDKAAQFKKPEKAKKKKKTKAKEAAKSAGGEHDEPQDDASQVIVSSALLPNSDIPSSSKISDQDEQVLSPVSISLPFQTAQSAGDMGRLSGQEQDHENTGWQVASKKRTAKVLPLKPQSTSAPLEPQDHRRLRGKMPPERPSPPPTKIPGNQSELDTKPPKKIDTRPSHAQRIAKGSSEGKNLGTNEATLAEAVSTCGIISEEKTLNLEEIDKDFVEPTAPTVKSRDLAVSITADDTVSLSSRHNPHIEEVQDLCVCPITQEAMIQPVVAMDGFTYEHEAILAWFAKHDTSPLTNEILVSKQLVPNLIVKQITEVLSGGK